MVSCDISNRNSQKRWIRYALLHSRDPRLTDEQESQIVRSTRNAGDNHVHLVLYFLHPSTFSSSSHAQPSRQTTLRNSKSMPSISRQSSLARSTEDTLKLDQVETSMSRSDIRMIKKLAKRANVIPVCHHSSASELAD